MPSISDIIEHHLKKILDESRSGTIEIKRSELADRFQCVPSQINYVISTRFTVEKGYIVESKRGGGGYIRIRRVRLASPGSVYDVLLRQIGESISQSQAEDIIDRLREEELMTPREARLMRRIIARDVMQLPVPLRDQVRARIMRAMVTILFAGKGE